MQVALYARNGQQSGSIELPEDVFGIEPNEHAVYLDVKQYLANRRQGTHKSKERSEMNGSTRKLKRQKGTGGARAGDINSPLMRGGARVFGPKPRDYSFKLNKKLKALARKSALSARAQANAIRVVEDFTFDAPKTKTFTGMLKSFEMTDKKVLLVLPTLDSNVLLSTRNVQRTKVVRASDINTYDVLNANQILISAACLPILTETLSK
jgi:large subunit ribosomal protein L4